MWHWLDGPSQLVFCWQSFYLFLVDLVWKSVILVKQNQVCSPITLPIPNGYTPPNDEDLWSKGLLQSFHLEFWFDLIDNDTFTRWYSAGYIISTMHRFL